MDPRKTGNDQMTDIKDLFNKYYGRLVHFSYQIVEEKAVAEDIVQDMFIRYWDRKEPLINNEASLKSYFYTSVRNASLNSVRHNKVTEQYRKQQDPAPVQEAVLQAIIRSEVFAELYGAIAKLPEACRQISLKSYLEGMKNHEIALELGISVNTVKTQKQRALKLLRIYLRPELLSLLTIFFP
ncbi:RNA polymerase sigma-70 factor [Hufsiella ginkgonis]|uniref:RNA polymerase sigma-70 factor n=1 Tax=Hufsiella ginkgonis TaxID=2695274 RepID=A0A7K1Y396_9SPHI|nr:RNA polymerase sigma-70 factor [Hufsiella ginkgonis]MXV17347.1 RNA polymerase sigma-70 factor [Hufsiella ginkgonis]